MNKDSLRMLTAVGSPTQKALVGMLLASLLVSCSLMPVTTISRKELLTPTVMTAVDTSTYTDMMYYGSDETYDYFTRNSLKYRVLRTENAVPASARFSFDNWQTGKLYRQVAAQGAAQKVSEWMNRYRQAQ